MFPAIGWGGFARLSEEDQQATIGYWWIHTGQDAAAERKGKAGAPTHRVKTGRKRG